MRWKSVCRMLWPEEYRHFKTEWAQLAERAPVYSYQSWITFHPFVQIDHAIGRDGSVADGVERQDN